LQNECQVNLEGNDNHNSQLHRQPPPFLPFPLYFLFFFFPFIISGFSLQDIIDILAGKDGAARSPPRQAPTTAGLDMERKKTKDVYCHRACTCSREKEQMQTRSVRLSPRLLHQPLKKMW